MVNIQTLTKSYGELEVLHIDDLIIESGETFGLVGNNGAGKTTLFSLILDLIRPSKGEVLINGSNVSVSEDWKKGTGAYLSQSFLLDFLIPEEYFEFIAGLHGWGKSDVNHFLGLFNEFFNDEILEGKKYIRDLSKGNQQKVGIVGSLIGDPELVILDEPFASLDPTSQARLKAIIKELDSRDKTILISSHDLNHVSEVCERIVILEKGQVVRDIQNSEDALAELKSYFSV